MRKKVMYFIIGFQLIIVALFFSMYYMIDYIGDEITLKTEPIDPRDPFRGDYQRLNYEISSLTLQQCHIASKRIKEYDSEVVKYVVDGKTFDDYELPQTWYLLLEKKPNTVAHQLADCTLTKPKNVAKNQVVLQAEKDSVSGESMFFDFPFERYYIEENTGFSGIWQDANTKNYLVTLHTGYFGLTKITDIVEVKEKL